MVTSVYDIESCHWELEKIATFLLVTIIRQV